MNDNITFTFKQHVVFLATAILVGSACFLVDRNNNNSSHYAEKIEQPLVMAQSEQTSYSKQVQH